MATVMPTLNTWYLLKKNCSGQIKHIFGWISPHTHQFTAQDSRKDSDQALFLRPVQRQDSVWLRPIDCQHMKCVPTHIHTIPWLPQASSTDRTRSPIPQHAHMHITGINATRCIINDAEYICRLAITNWLLWSDSWTRATWLAACNHRSRHCYPASVHTKPGKGSHDCMGSKRHRRCVGNVSRCSR